MHLSTLSLQWRTREGGGGQTRRDYLDFVIDGRSLLDLLPPNDQIGALGWIPPEFERAAIASLLLREPSGLPSGRVPLYVCPECGDLSCGAITARIEKTADAFVWSDLAWEVDYHVDPEDDGITERYEGLGPFAFPKAEYRRVLTERLDRLAAPSGF